MYKVEEPATMTTDIGIQEKENVWVRATLIQSGY
jgi:hypothetical protein